MKISDFIDGIFPFLLILSGLVILVTFISSLDPPPVGSSIGQWKARHFALYMLDLKHEGTIATWYSSALFLIAGISFVPLGWMNPNQMKKKPPVWIFRLNAFVLAFFSLDEMASIHEQIGLLVARMETGLPAIQPDNPGVVWVFVYAPFVFLGILLTGYAYQKWFELARFRGFAWILGFGGMGVLLIIVMELAGGRVQAAFEEGLEISVLCVLIYLNFSLSKALNA